MMALPTVAIELAGVALGLAAGVSLGTVVHRRVRGPQWTGPWRARLAFWVAWFTGAAVGQSVAQLVIGPHLLGAGGTEALARPPISWTDVGTSSAMLASIFCVVYVWKFRSGRPREVAPPRADG